MCQACLRANVLACQLGLHANVPACLVRQKRSNFLYLRANVSTWFASVSRGMPTFQAFLLTKCYMEISILYYYEQILHYTWYYKRHEYDGIRTIVPRLALKFESRLGLVLGLEGNQKIAPDENWSPVRVSFGNSGGNLPRGQLF